MVLTWAWIAAAGALGAMTRWWLGQWLFDMAFPYVTLGCNLIGSLALGWLLAAPILRHRERLRLALTTGFLGSFTTFSAFGYEWFVLISEGDLAAAMLYFGLSVGGGLGCAWLGYRFGSGKREGSG
jgi:CrcB protein